MKEDYLWDKTGEDPEIEKLENQLQAFRFRETAPPALPTREPIQKEQKKYRSLYALAACLLVSMILVGVWIKISSNTIINQTDLEAAHLPEHMLSNPVDLNVADPQGEQNEKIAISQHQTKHKMPQFGKPVPTTVRAAKMMTGNRQAAKQTVVTLTKEEKYAYNQLMLALSITSSKLKMVKDKVAGLEDSTAVYEIHSGKF